MKHTATVATLLLAISLRQRVKDGATVLSGGLPEAERRVEYWAHEVVRRVSLFASDPRGW